MITDVYSKVESALSMFRNAINQIDEANRILNESKQITEERIAELQIELASAVQTKEEAEKNIQANLELRGKLEQFVM